MQPGVCAPHVLQLDVTPCHDVQLVLLIEAVPARLPLPSCIDRTTCLSEEAMAMHCGDMAELSHLGTAHGRPSLLQTVLHHMRLRPPCANHGAGITALSQ